MAFVGEFAAGYFIALGGVVAAGGGGDGVEHAGGGTLAMAGIGQELVPIRSLL